MRHCSGPARPAAVHSVFDAVINIRTGDELLSLVCPRVGGSSRYLSIGRSRFSQYDFVPGQPCLLGKDEVQVGPLAITISHAPLWQGPLAKEARGAPSAKTAGAFADLLHSLSPGAGVHTGREPALLARLDTVDAIPDAIHGLIGLGPGLTPAGDDMVLGYVAVYNHLGPSREAEQALHAALLRDAHRTSYVSAQALRDATMYDYHEFIQDVVTCLVSHNTARLAVMLPRLLGIGASSGADMAAGMRAALQAITKHANETAGQEEWMQCAVCPEPGKR